MMITRIIYSAVRIPNNPTNAIAVCNCCIRKYGGLGIAQLKQECCTVNRACLCHSHLSKCEVFRETYSEEEVKKILALPL
ncbi:8359_t:CDS:2 [Gigaspora rosea]|nr:8359_t:CDS:2 [Gigaspora rosea]